MEKLTHDMATLHGRHRGVDALGGMTKAVDSGWAKLKIEASAAEKQARIDAGRDVIVGVNKYRREEQDAIEIRDIDNHAVREQQIARLAACARGAMRRKSGALQALTACAAGGTGNLLALSIEAVRVRATVVNQRCAGEGLGRHRADTQKVTGVYAAAYSDADDSAESWDD